METAAIQTIARRFVVQFRRRDPLAERVKLGWMDYVGSIMQGAMQGFARRLSM